LERLVKERTREKTGKRQKTFSLPEILEEKPWLRKRGRGGR